MTYDDNNKGAAWPNASDNVKAPQWTGKAIIDGTEKRVSVWIRTTKKGPTLSFTFEDPQQRGTGRQDGPRGSAKPEPDQGYDYAFDDDPTF